jgi:hypothetical protein
MWLQETAVKQLITGYEPRHTNNVVLGAGQEQSVTL